MFRTVSAGIVCITVPFFCFMGDNPSPPPGPAEKSLKLVYYNRVS
jgi:hypothetical protein